jgi:catechol 2,3-dioxygenase-like lactoylglutathione lyase family enzyme
LSIAHGSAQAVSALLPFIELDHVSIRVSDVQRSARFYMRLFGDDAARDPKRQANPGSQPGELWFVRHARRGGPAPEDEYLSADTDERRDYCRRAILTVAEHFLKDKYPGGPNWDENATSEEV